MFDTTSQLAHPCSELSSCSWARFLPLPSESLGSWRGLLAEAQEMERVGNASKYMPTSPAMRPPGQLIKHEKLGRPHWQTSEP